MDSPASFTARQYAFAANIRDPQRPLPDGVEPRRMAIYRELFYNNIENFAASAFPVLRAITPDEAWHAMVRDFMVTHRCQTPLFLEIAQEFLDYLQRERTAAKNDYPFLLELAHYEWVELVLSIDEAQPLAVDAKADLLQGVPHLSPLAWPLAYRYPVHRIAPDTIPDTESPTHLLVYRDSDEEVRFMELNPVTARLLQLIANNHGATGHELLLAIATELNHPQPEVVVAAGAAILYDLSTRGVAGIAAH